MLVPDHKILYMFAIAIRHKNQLLNTIRIKFFAKKSKLTTNFNIH